MVVGDLITFEKRRYRIVGFDPIGVTVRMVRLEDLDTSEPRVVPLDELEDRVASVKVVYESERVILA